MPKLPIGTKTLIIVNVLFFAVTYLVTDMKNSMIEWFALFFPMNEYFHLWQFVSSLFMHGGTTHLFFNMFALFSFGLVLETIWGIRKFLAFYFIVGIGAGLIYLGVNYFQFTTVYNELLSHGLSPIKIQAVLDTGYLDPEISSLFAEGRLQAFFSHYHTPALGASGAIYGILVAFGMMFPNAKLMLLFLPVPISAKYFIPALLAFDLFSGVTGFSLFGGGIAHFAHIGGAIIGFLLMMYWKSATPPSRDGIIDV
jgi:membrane associated rhomboid family serine protease